MLFVVAILRVPSLQLLWPESRWQVPRFVKKNWGQIVVTEYCLRCIVNQFLCTIYSPKEWRTRDSKKKNLFIWCKGLDVLESDEHFISLVGKHK